MKMLSAILLSLPALAIVIVLVHPTTGGLSQNKPSVSGASKSPPSPEDANVNVSFPKDSLWDLTDEDLAAGTTAQQQNAGEPEVTVTPPFTPVGSAEMLGSWGRVSMALFRGGNSAAKKHYSCFSFQPDGTFYHWGNEWGSSVNERGVYRLEGKKLTMAFLYVWHNGRDVPAKNRQPFTVSVAVGKDGYTWFDTGLLFSFGKGITWDSASECYRDADGDRLVSKRLQAAADRVSYVQEKAPAAGSRQECMATMRGVFKALAEYASTHNEEWPKSLGQESFLSILANRAVIRCPRTGEGYEYDSNSSNYTLRCPGCKQQL